MRQAEVDEDGQLDDRNQQEGQGNALLDDQDDDEDCEDGNGVDDLEVVVGRFDHVLHAGCLADEHPVFVILFEDGVQAVDLLVDLVACDFVFRVDEQQLPVFALEGADQPLRQDLLRHAGAEDGFQSEDIFDALDLVHLVYHVPHVLGGQVGIDEHHVRRSDVEFLGELGVCDDIFNVLREALTHVVVDLVVGLVIAVVGRVHQQREDDQENREHLRHAAGKAVHLRQDGAVLGFLQGLVEHEDQGRQHRDAADNAQQDALGHNDAQVLAQCEGHEAQRREARDGRHRGADHTRQRLVDGDGHGFLVVGVFRALLIVAVPEEDGIVHRDGQLQNC